MERAAQFGNPQPRALDGVLFGFGAVIFTFQSSAHSKPRWQGKQGGREDAQSCECVIFFLFKIYLTALDLSRGMWDLVL